MHRQVQAMLQDVQQLAATFKSTAPAILQALQEAAATAAAATAGDAKAVVAAAALFPGEAAAQQASTAADEVEADCSTAISHVKDGFGKLLYVVLLASLHHAGLQQPKTAAEAAAAVDSSNDEPEGPAECAAAVESAPE
jgi:hypothetical protein